MQFPPKKNLLQGNMALSFNQYRHILDNLRIGHMNNQIICSFRADCLLYIHFFPEDYVRNRCLIPFKRNKKSNIFNLHICIDYRVIKSIIIMCYFHFDILFERHRLKQCNKRNKLQIKPFTGV